MKTAKEMFEELGYVYTNDDGFTDYLKKKYDEEVKEWNFKEISFDRWSRKISVYSFRKNDDCTEFIHKGTQMKIVFLDEFELKAIHQQMKELGWIDE
jgi:hypothetical protein